MSKAARYGFGALSGAAGGAGIGTAILPGVGTAIGAGVGGLAGLLGGVLSEDEDDEQRKKAMAALEQRQALENDVYAFNERNKVGNDFANVFQSQVNWGEPLVNQRKVSELRGRGQQLDRDELAARMQSQDPSAGDWIGALIGAGGAAAGAFKSDPNAARKAQLNATSDEAAFIDGLPNGTAEERGWISDQGLRGRNIAEAENDSRTRSALFGPRRRMNPYEF